MAEYLYSPEARLDLLEIWEFIARDDVDAADRVEREIEQTLSMLARNPYLGHLRRDLTSKPVRFWPIYSYLIIYDPATQPLLAKGHRRTRFHLPIGLREREENHGPFSHGL